MCWLIDYNRLTGIGNSHKGSVECYPSGAVHEIGRLNAEPMTGCDQEQELSSQVLIRSSIINCSDDLLLILYMVFGEVSPIHYLMTIFLYSNFSANSASSR